MWARRLVSAAVGVAGTLGVLVVVLVMNAGTTLELGEEDAVGTTFEVAPPPPPPPEARPKPERRKPKPRRNPPPAPMVGANLAGLSFGLEGLGDAGLAGGADALLGETDDVVMTQDSVDDPPRALQQTAPVYPERARKKGITGRVVLSLLIDAGGSVQDVRVTESQPAGVFDEAAVSAVKTWRFKPALYEGRPVSIRVTLPLRFGFDA